MITRFRTYSWSFDIVEMEFVSETPNFCIDKNGRRHGKKTAHDVLHLSKDEAIAYVREGLNRKIEDAQDKVKYQEGQLAEFNKLYPL